MNCHHLLGRAVGLLLAAALGQTVPAAYGQLVQVRPGFVEAPLVRVYWGPDGSSYVRAPFVSVHSPGYWVAQPAMPVDYPRMNWAELVRAIKDSARRLDADLAQLPSASEWWTQLQTADLLALAPGDPQQPPADELHVRLSETLRRFDNVADMPQADRVVGLSSFRSVKAALGEYTTPGELRLRRRVLAAASELDAALARFQTGSDWQRYLALPPELTGAHADDGGQFPRPEMNDLLAALGRFDLVGRNEAYRMIAGLPAFRATHDSLAAYAALLQSGPAQTVEELPAPGPRPAGE